jgi:hypothetical protein
MPRGRVDHLTTMQTRFSIPQDQNRSRNLTEQTQDKPPHIRACEGVALFVHHTPAVRGHPSSCERMVRCQQTDENRCPAIGNGETPETAAKTMGRCSSVAVRWRRARRQGARWICTPQACSIIWATITHGFGSSVHQRRCSTWTQMTASRVSPLFLRLLELLAHGSRMSFLIPLHDLCVSTMCAAPRHACGAPRATLLECSAENVAFPHSDQEQVFFFAP